MALTTSIDISRTSSPSEIPQWMVLRPDPAAGMRRAPGAEWQPAEGIISWLRSGDAPRIWPSFTVGSPEPQNVFQVTPTEQPNQAVAPSLAVGILLFGLFLSIFAAGSRVEAKRVEDELRSLFLRSVEEPFEDGEENDFSRDFRAIITAKGLLALEALMRLLTETRLPESLLGEALSLIGDLEDPVMYDTRLFLLQNFLESPSPSVRSGAMLGLTSMGDKRSLHALMAARDREQSRLLRKSLDQAVSYIKSR